MVTATLTASGRDLRTLAGIISEDRGEPPPHGLAPSLLSDLFGLVRCDYLSFVGQDSGQQAGWFGQAVPFELGDGQEEGEEDASPFWEHYWASLPCSYPDQTGDLRNVTKLSDFCSARQWHNSGMHRDVHREVQHEMMVCLPADARWTASHTRPAGPGRTVRLLFFRGPGPDFSERDRALLTLLRPHLHQAYVDAEHRRRGTPQLTPRHWELLRLVAAGHTNGQIARRVGVTEGTVRKHLENIYARLHVSNRTAAITRAFPDRVT